MKLGFIGLGIMGTPMAGHLRAAGHDLFVTTRRTPPQALLDAGAVACKTAADVARQADVIFLMVPDTPDVEKVLFGKDGVAEGLSAGKAVVDMSSISPMATKAFAQAKVNLHSLTNYSVLVDQALRDEYITEKDLLPLNEWLKVLLGLCFDPATLDAARRAGIDAESLRRR